MDNARIAQILETSPEKVSDALQAFSTARRTAERVYSVAFIRYKHSESNNYSIEDAKNMALASEAYDEAKAEEIKAEAAYRLESDRQINARKAAELLKLGI